MKMRFAAAFLAGALLASASAYAQTATLGQPGAASITPANLGQRDVLTFTPGGQGGVPSGVSNLGTAGAQMQYQITVPLTGFTITAPNPSVANYMIINPAGTLATGTLTMPASPNDGGNFCFLSTQTQTALTVTASTGQTMGGTAVTALVAGMSKCWRYIGQLATWFPTQ